MDYNDINLEDLFYDRTRNLSGIEEFDDISGLACPSQGSSVEFMSRDLLVDTDNNYMNIVPLGVNSLMAKFNMSYEVTEGEAQKIVNFFESKEGVDSVDFDTDPTVYQKVNGYCSSYSLTQTEADNYSVQAVLEVSEAANHFNWLGMNFIDPPIRSTSYKTKNYEYVENDVVYDQREEGIYRDRMNSFYYCHKSHNSTDDTADYLRDSEYFTKDFFWSPDVGQSNTVEMDVSTFGGDYGLKTRRKTKDNTAIFPLEYQFKNITTKKLKAMLHFLESRGGYKRFKHQIAGVYNRPKVFVCKKWTHTWDSFDSHTLQMTLEEDPLGVIPKRVPSIPEDILTTLTTKFGETLTIDGNIPNSWVSGQNDYRTLDLGVSCQTIGDNAFYGLSGLNGDVVMPSTIQSVGDYAFYNCSRLDNLVLSRGLEVIGSSAFENCYQLEGDLVIPDSVSYISDKAFKNCRNLDGELSIGLDVSGIGSEAFRGCYRLGGELILPSGLLEIGSYAFADTDVFGRMYVPDTVTGIHDRAFNNCSFLGNVVTIESGVQDIGSYVFNNCRAIQKLEFKGKQAPASVNILAFEGLEGLNKRNGKKIIYAPLNSNGYDVLPWTDFEIVYQR